MAAVGATCARRCLPGRLGGSSSAFRRQPAVVRPLASHLVTSKRAEPVPATASPGKSSKLEGRRIAKAQDGPHAACILEPKELNTLPVTWAGALAAALTIASACPSAYAAAEQLNSTFTIPGIVGDSPLTEGIVSGFLLILFSEIGDKTFFIAMLLAAQQSKVEVFTGTFGALAIMTIISVGLGQVLHQLDGILPAGLTNVPLDDVLAVILLVAFGVRTLQAASDAEETAAEEKEEAKEVVEGFGGGQSLAFILSTFTLVFAAEWGDKSFIATIALAAASSPLGVTLGAVGGHGVATVIAVTFGSVLSNYVSERTVQYVGGTLFLLFAAATLVDLVAQV